MGGPWEKYKKPDLVGHAEKMLTPRFKDSGREATPFDVLSSYTSAPLKRAVMSKLTGQDTPLGFGTDPQSAPSGSAIMQKMGVSGDNRLQTAEQAEDFDKKFNPGRHASMKQLGKPYQEKQGLSPADYGGFVVDNLTDLTNYIPGEAFAKMGAGATGAVKNIGKAKKADGAIEVKNLADINSKALRKFPMQHIDEDTASNLGVKWSDQEYNYRLSGHSDVNYIFKDGKPVGHLAVDDEGSVKSLFVDKDHRGQGLAKKLYEDYFEKNGFLKSDDISAMEPEAKAIWQKLQSKYPDEIKKTKSGWVFEAKTNKPGGSQTILDKYDTLEKVKAIRGKPEYENYLKALDEVHGDQAKRAKDLGFGDETYYHGTNKSFDEFDPKLADSRRKTGVPESAMIFTDNPTVANSYADQVTSGFTGKKSWLETGGQVYPARLKLGKTARMNAKGANWNDLYDPKTKDTFTVNDFIESAKQKNKQSAVVSNIKDRGEGWGEAESAKTLAVFDPSQIRSKFAAFDPRFKDSPDLLAGGIGSVGKGLTTAAKIAGPWDRYKKSDKKSEQK